VVAAIDWRFGLYRRASAYTRIKYEKAKENLNSLFYLCISLLLMIPASSCFAGAHVNWRSVGGTVLVKSWKDFRDRRVVKQDKDYSCGSASLATILREYYGVPVTENDLLIAMDKGEMRASFEDMQKVLPRFGFKAQGYAASFEQLARLKIPVVVYLRHRKADHFSVLRGINNENVLLADPLLGNQTYSKSQFLAMWETRGSNSENAELKGKFLAILPESPEWQEDNNFFTKSPIRHTAAAIKQLSIRNFF
jgi:predicted double-glycine peptidase